MKKIVEYIKESYNELIHRVSWPTWSELQSTSVIVLIAAFIIAMVVFGMDTVFNETMRIVYKTLFGA